MTECFIFAVSKNVNVQNLGKIITGFVLLFAFLWATTGITIYSHYCSESENINKSLFVADAGCDHHEEDVIIESCCSEKKSCSEDATDSDCCATQKQIYKLASIFILPGEKQQIEILDFKLLEYKEILIEENDDLVCEISIPEELPPGNYGKKLVLAIHKQKIAPAPVV